MNKANIKVLYELEVKDKNGKLLTKQKGVSKSLLANFMHWFRAKLGNFSDEPVVDTGGVSRTILATSLQHSSGFGLMNAGDDDDDKGIMVGSGTVSVTPDDYQLASKISHGTTTGHLDYGPHTFEAVTVSDSVSSCRVSRTFTNLSGASVTVNELGIAIWMRDSADNGINVLILRDVLASPISVPDGATLTVRYTFQVTA